MFLLLLGACLVPVWAFRYLPTQDGPSHLANAIILKDYTVPGSRYAEFFRLRLEPFPNWTAHALLTALLWLVPPLAAEKILVSLYVVGFAVSFRYFLGAFGPNTQALAPAGLLFVFNFCFWMGFYSFLLSLIGLWIALGYCVRKRDPWGLRDAALLAVLFLATYLSHLVGFALAAAGATWLLATGPSNRMRSLGYLAVALAPSIGLMVGYLRGSGLFDASAWTGLEHVPKHGPGLLALFQLVIDGLEEAGFQPHARDSLPLGALVLLFYEALVLSTLAASPEPPAATDGPRSWPALVLALTLPVLALCLPNHFGARGGYLRPRLLLLAPLLVLPCLRLPPPSLGRRLLQGAMTALIGVNLVLVARYAWYANRELKEFTAGIPHAGQRRTLLFYRPPISARPDYWEHAGDYYCLTTGNIDLYNYEAERPYFPIRFGPDIRHSYRGDLAGYVAECRVDVLLIWGTPPPLPSEYRPSYRDGHLTIYERYGPE